MELEVINEGKKHSPLFTLVGTPIPAIKSWLPIVELRALGKDVQVAHPLRGALRLVGEEWVLGIKFPTKASANQASSLMCFRWDGNFGSALTLTVGAKLRGWIARGWIWACHPIVHALRSSHVLTVVSIYNGEPISVLRMQPAGEPDLRGIQFATDTTNEDARRPGKQLLELDEGLAYWETFALTDAWNTLLTVTDHLQVGWLYEFRKAVRYTANMIKDTLAVPEVTDGDKPHWEQSGHPIPQPFWEQAVLPLAEVLRGKASILQFVRANSAGNIMLVISDEEHRRSQNPFHELRWVVGMLAECALLSDVCTQFGRRVAFSTFDARSNPAVEIPTDGMSVQDASKYWENLPSAVALNAGELITASMQPADLALIVDQIKTIKLGCDWQDAENAIATMTEEANILNRWTIPWGARVQTSIGPFTEIDFYSYADEISILLKTSEQHYRWAAFNLRKNAWNLNHFLTNRFEGIISNHILDEHQIEEVTLALKLILASIVRDFVVVEERESAFGIRHDSTPRRRSIDLDSPRIIYIPRIRYVQSPDTKGLEKGLEYESRRPHHVRAHHRRADTASPYQRILAERYGFRLESGFTFVRPHQRGGIAPDREVIYRSRSAMQSLYGIDSSIESNGKSNWFQFERDVHDAMAYAGFKVDHVASAKNGDAGVDVFAEDKAGREFWAIQCKCYAPKRKIGPAAVRELIGALEGYPAGTRGMMVTTSGYSSGAIELAKRSGVELRLLNLSSDGRGNKVLTEI
ncbi:MAG: restriction endonuclease [Burkholderiaceae bacterium]|nr:restriction endonuclease [Burkholderiaceae bacterium]